MRTVSGKHHAKGGVDFYWYQAWWTIERSAVLWTVMIFRNLEASPFITHGKIDAILTSEEQAEPLVRRDVVQCIEAHFSEPYAAVREGKRTTANR